MNFSRTNKLLILLFLLMLAGSSLQLRAQTILETITLDDAPISFSDFSKMGSGYATTIQGAFSASDGNSYSGWTKGSVKYVSSDNKNVAQFGTANTGWLKSPKIESKYGFTVTVTYSSTTGSQLKIGSESAVTGPKEATASTDGIGLTISASTSSISTTFTITNAGSSLLYVSKITITPNASSTGGSEGTKMPAGISFAQESYTATLGQTFASPVLTNPNSLKDITYTSSDEKVATVDVSGNVSLVAAGTTTITAAFAGNDAYAAGSTSYTLTVQAATTSTANTFYKPITTTDSLVDGNICLLYCPKNKLMASSFDTANSWLRSSNEVTLENGCYTGEVNGDNLPYEITITQNNENYALSILGDYLVPSYLKTTFGINSSAKYSWGISFKTNGNVIIKNIEQTTTSRSIYFDNSSSYFKNTTSGSAVQLFQKRTTLQLKEAVQGLGTFYNKDFAYEMPQGVKGYFVTLDNNKNLSLTLAYDAGEPVPQGTPLLLYGKIGTYNPVVINKAITSAVGTNYMKGERDENGKICGGTDYVYYILTVDDSGNNIGFYYGADDGGAFVMKGETTAYLALPNNVASQVRGLILDPEAISHISTIQTPNANSFLYDISGRRVQHPKRGLYIQNGRVIFRK